MKKMFLLLGTVLSSASIFFCPSFVFAQNTGYSVHGINPGAFNQEHMIKTNGIRGDSQGGDHFSSTSALPNSSLSSLHQRCDTEITNRITSLNQAIARINSMTKLNDSQKAQYVASLQSTINSLTSLKTKCDADTDAQTLLTDLKSIVTNYRVYAQYLPQTAVLSATDRIQHIIDQLTTVATKLQDRITTAKGTGKDVTDLQNWLTDMQAKLTDAKTQLSTISGLVTPLQPTGFNKTEDKSVFQTAHTQLKAVFADLMGAYKDAKQIINGLRAFHDVMPSTTITPSLTTIPLPSTASSSAQQ